MDNRSESDSDFEDGCLWTYGKEDELGEGGPVCLAISGKWLVAGFSNGSIVRASYLEEFESDGIENGSSNALVSCSCLPSDEWFCPVLESDDIDDE